MTKTFSIALQGELNRSAARLATCIRIQRSDGNVYGFTTNRKSLTIGGIVYAPAASFLPTDISAGSDLDTDNLTVEALIDSAALTEDDLRAGRWDFAEYRIFQVNWADLTQGDKKDSTGHLGEVKIGAQTFMAELLGLMEAYATSIGETTQAGCRANLGDRRCKVDLTGTIGSPAQNLTVTGTIDSAVVSGTDAYFAVNDSARTEAADFFTEGVFVIHFATGDLSYEVKAYSPGAWTTKTPIAYDASGIAYTMKAGCQKRLLEDCLGRFNNVANFRGEPYLRGNDALVQVGRHS